MAKRKENIKKEEPFFFFFSLSLSLSTLAEIRVTISTISKTNVCGRV
jgi:hypothetical protein